MCPMIPKIAVDNLGIVHVFWYEYFYLSSKTEIYYTQRDINGEWSWRKPSLRQPVNYYDYQFVVEPDGSVHVVWSNWQGGILLPIVVTMATGRIRSI